MAKSTDVAQGVSPCYNNPDCLCDAQMQALVRAQQARRRFVQQRCAALLLQRQWRVVLARHAAHRAQAATSLQRYCAGTA